MQQLDVAEISMTDWGVGHMKFVMSALLLCVVLLAAPSEGNETTSLLGNVDSYRAEDGEIWIGVFPTTPTHRWKEGQWVAVDSEEFTLEIPNVDEILLLVLRKDAVPQVTAVYKLTTIPIILTAHEGMTLRGTVVSTDGLPVADATLTLSRPDLPPIEIPDKAQPEWTTDSEGRFSISGLVEGRYDINVSSPYVPKESFSVQVSENSASPHELKLDNAFFVAGHVVDHDGAGVYGAEVDTRPYILFLEDYRGIVQMSGEDGGFLLGPFVRAQDMRLSARHVEGGSTYSHSVIAGKHDVKLVLSAMVQVRGMVIDAATGIPVDEFVLKAYGQGWMREYQHNDAQGQLSAPVDSEARGLVVDSPEYSAFINMEISLESLEEHDLGTIELDPGRTVSGQVYDVANREPIEGAEVSCLGEGWTGVMQTLERTFTSRYLTQSVRSVTDVNGEYTLKPMPTEETVLYVTATGYESQEVRLEVGQTSADVALRIWDPDRTRIFGRIETTTGEAVAGSVEFFHVENNSGVGFGTEEDGSFEFSTRPGTHQVSASTEYGRAETVTLKMQDGDNTEVILVVDPSGSLYGSVKGLQGAETAFLSISDSERSIRSKHLSENGDFVIQGVGYGAFTLRARTSMNRELKRSFEIPESTGEARLDLFFGGSSRLYGSLVSGDGEMPVARVRATPVEDLATHGWGNVLDDGSFEIQGLDDGEYLIETFLRSGESYASEDGERIHHVKIELAGDTELLIQLQKH